jgi:hypothetical protein
MLTCLMLLAGTAVAADVGDPSSTVTFYVH